MTKITDFFQSSRRSSKKRRELTAKKEESSTENQQNAEGLLGTQKSSLVQTSSSGTQSAKRIRRDNSGDDDGDEVEKLLSHLMDESGGWKKALQKQFQSSSFRNLSKFVAKERAAHTVYPTADNTWTALNCTPLEKIRVVIVGQDPYHGPNQAHGAAFSVLPGNAVPPSLKNMYKELSEDPAVPFPKNKVLPKHGHLIRWAQQGVLLLNTVLTVRSGEPNSHKKRGWEEVTDGIIRAVDRHAQSTGQGCVFLLWGKPATTKAMQLISSNSSNHTVVIATSHPSPLGARKTSAPFLGSRCFSRCNAALEKMGHEPIDWNVD